MKSVFPRPLAENTPVPGLSVCSTPSRKPRLSEHSKQICAFLATDESYPTNRGTSSARAAELVPQLLVSSPCQRSLCEQKARRHCPALAGVASPHNHPSPLTTSADGCCLRRGSNPAHPSLGRSLGLLPQFPSSADGRRSVGGFCSAPVQALEEGAEGSRCPLSQCSITKALKVPAV